MRECDIAVITKYHSEVEKTCKQVGAAKSAQPLVESMTQYSSHPLVLPPLLFSTLVTAAGFL